MKLIIKHAFINIVRIPARTILCFLVAFTTAAVSAVCFHIYSSVVCAKSSFVESYPFVATVTVRKITSPDGTYIPSESSLTLDNISMLAKSDSVHAYNISLSAGVLGEDEFMGRIPDESLFTAEPPETLVYTDQTRVIAVNNILLTEAFFSGDSTIISGSLFDAEDMRGGQYPIIISEHTAARYGVFVGGTVTLKVNGRSNYSIYTVTGIYRSLRGMTSAYIPLTDFFRDRTAFGSYGAYLENNKPRFDTVSRLDFMLDSPDGAEKFINDAIAEGFDISSFDISVNDKPYKSILQSMDGIMSMSLGILIAVIAVSTIVFVLVCFFFSLSRKYERTVLRAMGMKNVQINAMFACEIIIIAVFALVSGIITGYAVSDTAIQAVERSSVASVVEEANLVKTADTIREQRGLTLQRKIEISLTQGCSKLEGYISPVSSLPDDGIGLRFECFWDKERSLRLIGITEFDVPDFTNAASYDREICSEPHRLTGYVFRCYVPQGSGYTAGSIIQVSTRKENTGVMFITNDGVPAYETPMTVSISLIVAGEYVSDKYSDIIMPMAELELMCDYVGVSGDVYRTVRFDEIIRRQK